MTSVLSLAAGSLAGGFARYFLSSAATRLWGGSFPYGTLLVNLLGCLLVGFLSSVAEGRLALNSNARLLLMVGFCGAFTTFSAFMLETAQLIKSGDHLQAFLNVSLSFAVGYILFCAGVMLGKSV